MARALATLLFLAVLPASAGVTHPVVAYPISAGLVSDPRFVAILADVLWHTAFGHRLTESAAFLVVGESVGIDCQLWPVSGEFRRQSFHGRWPQGVFAVVHSHPQDSPDPSSHDAAEAERTGMPMLVITRDNISVAAPDGRTEALIRDRFWVPGGWKHRACLCAAQRSKSAGNR